MENIKIADLCLFVIDSNSKLEPEDEKIAKALKGKTTIVILNKTDKKCGNNSYRTKKNRFGFETDDIVETSTPKDKTPAGIEKLEERIAEKKVCSGHNKKRRSIRIKHKTKRFSGKSERVCRFSFKRCWYAF